MIKIKDSKKKKRDAEITIKNTHQMKMLKYHITQ